MGTAKASRHLGRPPLRRPDDGSRAMARPPAAGNRQWRGSERSQRTAGRQDPTVQRHRHPPAPPRHDSNVAAAGGGAEAASTANDAVLPPVAVPRNPGVADGAWSTRDATLVATATANDRPPRRKRFSEHGMTRCRRSIDSTCLPHKPEGSCNDRLMCIWEGPHCDFRISPPAVPRFPHAPDV